MGCKLTWTSSNNMRWVNLQNGQSVLGRNPGWFTPATDSNRPTIDGGLFWGDASTSTIANGFLSRVIVINRNQTIPLAVTGLNSDSVIAAGATGELVVQNSVLIATYSAEGTVETAQAIGVFSGNLATVENSNLMAEAMHSGTGVANAQGIGAENVTVFGGTQTATATSTSSAAFAFGILAGNTFVCGATQTA